MASGIGKGERERGVKANRLTFRLIDFFDIRAFDYFTKKHLGFRFDDLRDIAGREFVFNDFNCDETSGIMITWTNFEDCPLLKTSSGSRSKKKLSRAVRIPSSKRGATFFCPCPVLLEKDAGHYRMFLHVSSRFCREREFVHVSVLRDNAKEKYGSQDSHRRGEEGTRGGQMFSQRSNEK